MEVTFDKVKEMLQFVLKDESIVVTSYGPVPLIHLHNLDTKKYYTITKASENNNHYIEIELYFKDAPFLSSAGRCLVPISNVELKEFEMLTAQIQERNNRICGDCFNLDFLTNIYKWK